MKKILAILTLFLIFVTSLFSQTISIGDEVSMVADKVKVRSCADLSCSLNGRVDIGTIGNIVDGPVDEDNYYWWKVDWEDGQPSGWTPTPKSGNSWYYEKPEGLSPGGSSSSPVVVDDTTPILRWNKIDGVDHFLVSIIEKSSGDVTYHDNIDGGAISYTIPSSLKEGERYLWSVIPYDADDDMGLKAEYIYFDVKIKADDNDFYCTDIYVNQTGGIDSNDKLTIRVIQNYSGESTTTLKPYVGFYLSKDKYFDKNKDYYLGKGKSSLSNSDTDDEEEIKDVSIPEDTQSGTYYILAVADYNNNYDENNENNNVDYKKVTIADVKKPDLQVESRYIEIRPSSGIEIGDEFSVRLNSIYNRGDAKSDRYGIRFMYGGTSSSNSAFERFDGDSGFSVLDAGEQGSRVISKEIETSNSSGTHYVKVCVYDNPSDSNHNNDCIIKSFEVEGNVNDPNKPKIDSIIPSPIISSSSKQTITIDGENFTSSSKIKWKTSSGSNGTVSSGGTYYKSTSQIQVYIRVTSVSDTWYFKVVNTDGSESSWKNVQNQKSNSSEAYKPVIIDGDTSVKGGKSNEKIDFTFKAVDEDDLAQGQISYTLRIKWGDGEQQDFTKEYDKSVTISHIYNNNKTTTYNMRVYAIDSDGQQSYINKSVKIQGSNSSSVPIDKTSYNRIEVANDPCAKPRSVGNSVDKASGAENFSITPLKVKGLISLPFTLQYNSLLLSSGDISKGWSYNYNVSSRIVKIEKKSSDIYRVYWDNSSKKYNDYIYDIDKQYYKSLEKATVDDIFTAKSNGTFTVEKKSGTIYTYNRRGYIVSIKNYKEQGFIIEFDDNGKLKKINEPISGVYLSYTYNSNGQLKEVKDNTGRKSNLYYNLDGLLIRVDYPDGTKHLFGYNETEQIDKYEIKDVDGKKITYFVLSYKDDGRVSAEKDGRDVISWFFYDTDKKPNIIISTYRDKNHQEIKTDYNSTNFNPNHIEYPDGKKEDFTYYSNGKLKTKTDRVNNTTEYYYDSKGNLEKVKYGDNSEELYMYDEHRNITKKTIKDKHGKTYVTINTYDADNNLKSTKLPNQVMSTFTYNGNNQMLTKTTDGKTITYEYNTKGYLELVRTDEGIETSYTYDNAGRLKTENTLQSGTTTYTYDVMDNVKTIKNQANKTQTFKYDLMGHKIEEKDFNGNVITYTYDANGNMIEKTDAMSNVWIFEYDSADRLSKSYDPLNNYVEYKYDSMGRVIKTIDKRGNATTYSYDAMGNLKTQTNPYGHTLFTHTYDSHNNLIKSVDILNHTTTTDYTVFGKPSQVTDPLQRVTEFKYDAIGRLIDVINAKSKTATQSYNKDGTLKEFTDAGGSTTVFTYDDDGKLITTETASGSTTTNGYDAKGLLATFKNGRNDTKRFTYDTLGRVTQAKDKDGTIDYTYDDNGNLLTIKENGKTITYTYDALNRVESYVNVWGETTGYEYDVVGNLAKLTYPNGKEVEYSYDENSNLIEVKEGTHKTTYTYDKNNRLIEMTRANGTVLKREYNNAGQLELQTDKTSNGTVISSVEFTYDKVGNIVEETRTPEVAPKVPVNIDMSYLYGNLLDEANQTQASFDADENMLSFGSKSYSYDSRNRLVSHGAYSYGYDAQNHRVSLTTNGSTTKYSINPNAPLSQLLEMTKANGEKSIYSYGLGLLSQEVNGKRLYYHYDLRGSTIALTDESGNIIDRWSYLPYGGQISHDKGSTQTPFLYNGRDGVMTDESGLYYMRARYYDPTIRRFINRDTLLGELGEMATLNRFGYVNGNPVSGVDPLGLFKWTYAAGNIFGMLVNAENVVYGNALNGTESFINKTFGTNISLEGNAVIKSGLQGVASNLEGFGNAIGYKESGKLASSIVNNVANNLYKGDTSNSKILKLVELGKLLYDVHSLNKTISKDYVNMDRAKIWSQNSSHGANWMNKYNMLYKKRYTNIIEDLTVHRAYDYYELYCNTVGSK